MSSNLISSISINKQKIRFSDKLFYNYIFDIIYKMMLFTINDTRNKMRNK